MKFQKTAANFHLVIETECVHEQSLLPPQVNPSASQEKSSDLLCEAAPRMHVCRSEGIVF